MFVAIIGSRDFTNYEYLKYKCDQILNQSKGITIISGGARGTDRMAERYATEKNLPIVIMKADWIQNGKSAGMIRNRLMLKVATHVIAFWDYQSPGTKHMIESAKRLKKQTRIISTKIKQACQLPS